MLTRPEMQRILVTLCNDSQSGSIIYQQRNRTVLRFFIAPQTSLIVKLWARPDWRGAARRWLRISPPDYEWHNLERFRRAGVRVPRVYGYCRVPPNAKCYTDALFLEDLGETTSATEHVKHLIRSAREDRVQSFESQMIDMTCVMVGAGIVDTDHGLINTVVSASGEPVRLDLEMARSAWYPALRWHAYGRMIGQLVSTYAFAVQPDTSRATAFALRLAERLNPPRRVLRGAARYIDAMMDEQLRSANIDTRLNLPW